MAAQCKQQKTDPQPQEDPGKTLPAFSHTCWYSCFYEEVLATSKLNLPRSKVGRGAHHQDMEKAHGGKCKSCSEKD